MPMINLLLSILSSTGIFLIFRLIEKREVKTFPVIVFNYITATGTGFILCRGTVTGIARELPLPFYLLAALIGILFIGMFFIVARSSQKAGMAVTTIAGKMSVIFPIAFSILYDPGDAISPLKATGILVALPGVLLTVYKKRDRLPDLSLLYLPLILFVGLGVVDSLVKLAQYKFVPDSNLSFFTTLLFAISATCGILISLVSRERFRSLFNPRVVAWGMLLGLVNFGSIYFLVRALNYHHPVRGSIDSSVVFGINNIGIVILSVLLGVMLFRERLSRINAAGMAICILATLILSHSSA
jgi:drug/metabolite transporter (DMT)-like permease